VKQMNLTQRKEEAVEDILATPEQGKRAAARGLSILNRGPKDMAVLEARAE